MREPRRDGALAGLAVLDASGHFAGRYAARLFADHGADVELVEGRPDAPRIGRAVYQAGERPIGESAQFRHLNTGKFRTERSALDPGDPADHDAVVAAAAGFDVVVVADPALADRIVERCGRPLVGLVTEFGRRGPYVEWHAGELVHQALSGSMFINGLADRPPLYGHGNRTAYAAGSYLYVGLVAGLIGRMRSDAAGDGRTGPGRPDLVEVSVHECAAAMEQNFSGQWTYNRTLTVRDEMARPKGRVRCRDGWVVYFLRPDQWSIYCRLLDRDDLIEDPRFRHWADLSMAWREAEAELRGSGGHLEVADLVAGAAEHGLILAPILEPAAQFDDPQLAARDYWRWVDWPEAGRRRALGPICRMSHTPVVPPSPVTGRDDWTPAPEPWVGGGAGVGATESESPIGKPLSGLRVLDLTVAWAGPMAGRHLAMLGAEVIKLEGPTRHDTWRGELGSPSRTHLYPDGVPGDRPYDRSCWFNSQNHDKVTVALDTKSAEGLDLARRLALRSDVVLVNYTPGALDRMGLGYADLVTDSPEIVVVEMPAFGSGGPQSSLKGLGPTMEAMAGMASMIGYPDSGPLGSGSAYLDPVGALHGAAATLTALAHRIRFGAGQHVEVTQREAAMHWAGEILLAIEVGAAPPVTVGNDRPGGAPHGAYPTRGLDEWVAIDASDDGAFGVLCRRLDRPELASDPRFESADERWRHRRELDEALSVATIGFGRHELASRLQAAGVRAAAVHHGGDLVGDPHLNANGWFTALDHAEVGRYAYAGLPYVIDGRRLEHERSSPTFGQHNHEILVGTLGLAEERYRDLLARGIVSDVPRIGLNSGLLRDRRVRRGATRSAGTVGIRMTAMTDPSSTTPPSTWTAVTGSSWIGQASPTATRCMARR